MPDSSRALVVAIDRDLCMGSGMCVMYAGNTFAVDEQTKAVIVDAAGDPEEQILNAVEACPTGALSVVGTGAAT